MKKIEHKRGDTFDFSGYVSLETDQSTITNFTGWSAASQIRASDGSLLSTLTVEWPDITTGLIRVFASGGTKTWKIGAAVMDIEFTSPGDAKVSTKTIHFDIISDVTRQP